MEDEGIHNRIEQLVAEEHDLYERVRDPEVVERYEQ